MESSAARQRGEREAPENTKSVGLHRAQELLELLAAVIIHRLPAISWRGFRGFGNPARASGL